MPLFSFASIVQLQGFLNHAFREIAQLQIDELSGQALKLK